MSLSLVLLLVVAVSLLDSCIAADWHGYVFFYTDVNFGGSMTRYSVHSSQECYALRNVDVGKAASAKWDNLVQDGTLGSDKKGHAQIAFYTDSTCQSAAKTFSTKAENFPTNFALNGIKDKIAGFMVMETSETVKGTAAPQWLQPKPTLGNFDPNAQ
ncbi:hypothetical protein BBJ28_00001541 [Nothophytophthora sp. Chile5]|nr:hypothetical protein BBJ28_00001541 [Nothophytophthora sp. Chile5]